MDNQDTAIDELEATRQHSEPAPAARQGHLGVSAVERRGMEMLLAMLGHPPFQVEFWDGTRVPATLPGSIGTVQVHDRPALFGLLTQPELRFGEAYRRGSLTVEGDLTEILVAVNKGLRRSKPVRLKARALRHLPRTRNSLKRARDNIHHHYDLGNDFYELWLDRQLVYTCAYFAEPEMSLEDAQIAKLDHVARKLWLRPGERVIEAGCGWGALALHMAREYGVSVRAYNISTEQLSYARERAEREGLADRVQFIEGDYREIEGDCDAFVSVGMLEHVGPDHYQDLGDVIRQSVHDDGRALIHSIGRDWARPMNPWIDRHIFPGANPPSLRQMTDIFEHSELSVLDVENLRLHYARTLEHWLERFADNVERVRDMFDEEFVRIWNLYLAGSIAAFRSGDLQLFQVVAAPTGSGDIPWHRGYLYGR
jgi:cyclopropane-fatty-acyl-phospholipid synthase